MTIEIILIIIIAIFMLFFGLGSLFWYAFRFEVRNFQMINNKIYLKNKSNQKNQNNIDKLESAAENSTINEDLNLKILHLSDFHLRNDFKGKKLKKFLKILALDSYDFIFITGDMVEKDELQDELIETLKPFKAKYGIYAVFGAHDYYNKKPTEFIKNMFKKRESYSRKNNVTGLRKKLESIGVKVLQNENVILKNIAGYNEIDIIGVDDPIINKMDLNKSLAGIFKDNKVVKIINLLSDLTKQNKLSESNFINEQSEIKNQRNQYLINTLAIKKTNEYKQTFSLSEDNFHKLNEKNMLKIALIHTPDSYALVNLALNAVDIVFAGHTHGGQVRIPFKGAIISGCNLKTKYAAGLFYFKKFVLQVSKGLGEGRFSRFRIYCDPEAIVTCLIKK
ncbi:MAG: metallophosphoesterase [Cyanobacteria bacterium]|nr:metallophosphoesterase [Cyanobacteriota bacterium]